MWTVRTTAHYRAVASRSRVADITRLCQDLDGAMTESSEFGWEEKCRRIGENQTLSPEADGTRRHGRRNGEWLTGAVVVGGEPQHGATDNARSVVACDIASPQLTHDIWMVAGKD